MKYQQFVGLLLLLVGSMVITGMLLGNCNPIYWLVIGVAIVVICSGSGIYLLQKKQVQ
jgi:hypothetical protein